MKSQPQQKSKEVPLSNNSERFRNLMIMYLDIVIRSLISFIFIGILLSFVFIGVLHISWIFVLPMVFFVSILVSPLLSKIKLGERVFLYYEEWLKKAFKL